MYHVNIIARDYFGEVTCESEYGEWVPARPISFDGFWERIGQAWLVLTNQADVLIWSKPKVNRHAQ